MRFIILVIFFIGCNSSGDIDEYNLLESKDLDENKISIPTIIITREGLPLVKAKSNSLIKNQVENVNIVCLWNR